MLWSEFGFGKSGNKLRTKVFYKMTRLEEFYRCLQCPIQKANVIRKLFMEIEIGYRFHATVPLTSKDDEKCISDNFSDTFTLF